MRSRRNQRGYLAGVYYAELRASLDPASRPPITRSEMNKALEAEYADVDLDERYQWAAFEAGYLEKRNALGVEL